METDMPKLARPMLQGVKCLLLDGKPYQITGRNAKDRFITKPIKNHMVNELLGGLPQFMGEIVVGDPTAEDCELETQKCLDNENLIFLFVLWVYDLKTVGMYQLDNRLQMAESMVLACGPVVQYADHTIIENDTALEAYKEVVVGAGYPGVVLREVWGTFGTYDEEIKAEADTPAAS
jgi:hypothetical protein